MQYPVTPDGRYFAVRGRLWRCTNPKLDPVHRAELTRELMSARNAKRLALRAGDIDGLEAARRRVDAAKVALGERGPVWWCDGAPDYNRHMARTTTYAAWLAAWARQPAVRMRVAGVARLRCTARPSSRPSCSIDVSDVRGTGEMDRSGGKKQRCYFPPECIIVRT